MDNNNNNFNSKGYKLTPKQRKFCETYLSNNGNGTAAARIAYGYKAHNLAAVTAYDNLRKPNIKAYLSDKGDIAGAIIMELAQDKDTKSSVRLDASKFVYEQVYGKASQKTEVVHSGVVSLAGLYSKASPTTLREKNSTGGSQSDDLGEVVEAIEVQQIDAD